MNQNGDMVPVLKFGTASGIAFAIGSTATNTATTGLGAGVVRVTSDLSVNIRFHLSATEALASTTDLRIPANSPESFDISEMARGGPFMSWIGTTCTATGVLGTVWISQSV